MALKAVAMNQTGDVGVLAHVDQPDPLPAPGMVPVHIAFAGVNFMDIGASGHGIDRNAQSEDPGR
ncbi:hypothetical protein [Variovorax sp. Root473]|uniref:hypothetical protein n=1 Tax=Variovorax sp. Root473 TaxID=1736541 RepID=UPI001F33FCEC|nr:hypothetical protein [Variovorax sp. Root473]